MFNSMDTRVLWFGLGNLGCPPHIKVTWPDGEVAWFAGHEFGQNTEVTIQYGDQGEPPETEAYLPSLYNETIEEP